MTHIGGEWYFEEFTRGAGVATVRSDENAEPPQAPASTDEKKKIVDLFKN
jgi:penicillin-binding protein 1A